ncbi:MAG: hypothetical protein EXS14_06010 [Planctomycetes bacterium]|nr:hypothetical protein [Planctomycetota bacterium]
MLQRFVLALTIVLSAALQAQSPATLRVVAMPTLADLEGTSTPNGALIDERFLSAWRHERDAAVADSIDVLVFELSTPGGTLFHTRQVMDDLQTLRAAGVRTVAYVPHQALSGGALLAAACAETACAPGAEIGNAIPVEFNDTGHMREAPAKILSDVLGLMQRCAAAGSFATAPLLEAMVNPDTELLVVTPPGSAARLMTLAEYRRDFPQAAGNISVRTVKSAGTALVLVSGGNTVGLPGLKLHTVRAREELPAALSLPGRTLDVRTLPLQGRGLFGVAFGDIDFSLLLILLGLFFLVLELKTPGVGIAGALALLCLVAGFLMRSADGPPIVITAGLLLCGVLLLMLEFVVFPGFGVPGVAGIILVILSIYTATVGLPGKTLLEQTIPDSPADWLLVKGFGLRFVLSMLCSVGGVLLLAPTLHRLPLFRAAFLSPPILEPVASGSRSPAAAGAVSATGFVVVSTGALGISTTPLRPAGKAMFAGREVDVVSEGPFIDSGLSVRVLRVSGNRVEVRAEELRA